jgi:hypothetical protein
MLGGWPTVACLTLSGIFCLPILRPYVLGCRITHVEALLLAISCLAPFWPLWWQRWLAWAVLGLILVRMTVYRGYTLEQLEVKFGSPVPVKQ